MKLTSLGLAVLCVAALPLRAQAQNNTSASPLRTAPNATLYTYTDDTTNAQRWYRFGVAANRSYCVETGMAEIVAANSSGFNDSVLQLFSDAGTTSTGTNDDNAVEPTHAGGGASIGPSRVCNITTAAGTRYVELTDLESGTMQWKLKFSDTTLFAPWFFSGGGYEAFILIKNTTGTATTVRTTLYQTSGAAIAFITGTAPANGSLNLQISAILGTGTFTGGVAIATDAAPGGVVASVTSLNFGAGVSFDVSASPRQDWRQ